MNAARLLPASLFGRLAVLLTSAFVFLNAATFVTIRVLEERQAARSALSDQAGSLALTLRLLDHADLEGGRASLVDRLERLEALSIRQTTRPDPPAQGEDALSLHLKERLLHNLGSLHGSHLAPGDLLTEVRRIRRSESADKAIQDGENRVLGEIYESRLAVRLHDGAWISLTQSSAAAGPTYVALILISLEILLTVLLALLLTHRVVRPLRVLALTAERFGRDVEYADMLPESGPTEVREAARAFNRMRDKIRATLSRHQRMLASVAHDLRTPLTRMRLRLENAPHGELRDKLLADLGVLGGIMESSAELTRGAESREAAALADMTAFLESIVADRQDMGQDVRLFGDCGGSFPIKAKALRRCLGNLLDNALRYAGSAEIRVARRDGRLIIDVLDTGPGIPEAELQKVFEPFYRLDPARSRHTGGSGLGLSIARLMAELNNGEIVLFNRECPAQSDGGQQAEPGKGSQGRESGGLCARISLRRI